MSMESRFTTFLMLSLMRMRILKNKLGSSRYRLFSLKLFISQWLCCCCVCVCVRFNKPQQWEFFMDWSSPALYPLIKFHEPYSITLHVCFKCYCSCNWLNQDHRHMDYSSFSRLASHLQWWDPTSRLRPRGRRWGAVCTLGEWWRWRIQNTMTSSSCGSCWCEWQEEVEEATTHCFPYSLNIFVR